jgi:8-oxo-dGTP pyrophosphatase MutT (NUDIX family)
MADYVRTIRRSIGHDLLMLPTTAFILLNDRDEILLQRRSDNGLWCCPGGTLDLGETVLESARREVLEETGLTVGRCELFGVYSGPELRAEYPNGDRTAVVQYVFVTRDFAGELLHDAESTELRFTPLDTLPQNIARSHAAFLGEVAAWVRGELRLPVVP